MFNSTGSDALPPLPPYTLAPKAPLIPHLPDEYFALLVPIMCYWSFSLVFHAIDTLDLFPQYRLHTPVEILKRNRVSKGEVVRSVLTQQVFQCVIGVLLAGSPDLYGRESYDVAVWARRVRKTQRIIPALLSVVGIDARGLAKGLAMSHPTIAYALAGGRSPASIANMSQSASALPFAFWELAVAKAIYWLLIPLFQYVAAILVAETWQYFTHRLFHENKWLYRNVHSRHHKLYVPYCWGGIYSHPIEGIFIDILEIVLAVAVTGMTTRQAMGLYVMSTYKSITDHCGYAFPWDPLQVLSGNRSEFHDLHHQNWGLKYNYSEYTAIWDRIMGTVYPGDDVAERYMKDRNAAQRALERDEKTARSSATAHDQKVNGVVEPVAH